MAHELSISEIDDVDYAVRAFCTCGWAQDHWVHAHDMPSASDDMQAAERAARLAASNAADAHQRSTTALRFIGVWDADTMYEAVGFGRTWNGWATPIVTREVLAQVIADAPGVPRSLPPGVGGSADRHRPGDR